MRKLIALSTVVVGASLTSLNSHALELNVNAAANFWKPTPSGYIQGNKSDQPLDVKQTLGLSSEKQTSFTLQLDHPVPVIPNIRISRTELEFGGHSSKGFTFDGKNFTGDITSQIDLTHTDFTAYYRFLDGLTSLIPLVGLRAELGITVRQFDGGFKVTGQVAGQQATEYLELSTPVPMGYAGLRVNLPYGISAGANVNAIGYSGNQITDWVADVRYQYEGLPLIKPGIQAGYRSFDVKLDDLKDTYGDLSLKGGYFGAYVQAGF